MTTYNVPEMHCEHCVSRIEKALGELAVEFSISLDDRTVSASGDSAAVIEALEDLGFSAEPVK